MKITSLLLGVGALFTALSVSAQNYEGVSSADPSRAQTLHDGLVAYQASEAGTATNEQYASAAFATAYVMGVVDALYGTKICPAHGVTRGQDFHIVLKYLDDHPGEWQLGSPAMIVRAFNTVMPCPRSGG
jgi:Rap1a immunity proteins